MQQGNRVIKAAKANILTSQIRLFMLAVSLMLSLSLSAAGIKNNDQSLMIKTDASGCATEVVLTSPDDNCSGSEFANNCGKNGKDCVCMRNNKFITWSVDRDTKFEIKLSGPDPFTGSCNLKSKNKPRIKCKLTAGNGDYMYDVVLQSCPSQTYDPKIIVRN